jgi:hypothetical protein
MLAITSIDTDVSGTDGALCSVLTTLTAYESDPDEDRTDTLLSLLTIPAFIAFNGVTEVALMAVGVSGVVSSTEAANTGQRTGTDGLVASL